ncbi:MAG: hypothetical protein KY467_18065 [Gemmatimonadetes bacterium]|nr:hypothetical protein [Gemmatimonadota bacterium]
MRTIARSAAAAVVCLVVSACGDGAGGGPDPGLDPVGDVGQAGAATDAETTTPGEDAAPNVAPVPRPEQVVVAGRLSPVNNSGVTGSATLHALGEQTEILLNVTGISEGNRLLHGSIVQGTCERPGTVVAPVGPIPVGAGNIATLTDTIPLPALTVLNGAHALQVKGDNAGPATPPLACSPLPRWERPAG